MAVSRWKYKFAKDYPSFSAMKNKIANGVEGSLSSRTTIRDNGIMKHLRYIFVKQRACESFSLLKSSLPRSSLLSGNKQKKKKKKER